MGKEYSRQKSLNEMQYQFEREEADKARSFNAGESQLARDFNALEAQKARDFERAQTLQAQQYQSEQWQRQADFELQHRFDVPAGVNPAVYFSGKGAAAGYGGSVSAPSGGAAPVAASSPAAISPLPSHVTPSALPDSVPSFIANLGQFVDALGSAVKNGLDTAQAAKQFDLIYDKAVEELAGQRLQNAAQDFANYCSQIKLPYELQRLIIDVAKLEQDKLTAISQGKAFESEAELNYARKATENKISELKGTEGLILKFKYDNIQKEFDSEIQLKKSQAVSNYASSRASNTQANLNVKVGSYYDQLSRGEKFWNDLNQQERESLTSKLLAECNSVGLANKVSEEKYELFKQLAKKFENENDWFIANQILDRMQQIAGDIIDLKNIKLKQDDIAGKYGDTYEDHYSSYDDQGRKHSYVKKYNRSGQKYKGKY